jgi:kynurenine 3-monooxygenase
MKSVTIVGGGLVGSLLAVLMSKRGYAVSVYERRPDIRKAEISAGKSINLALSDRGWKALGIVGIEKEVREIATPMYGRKMHAVSGEVTYQPYGLEGQAIYSVSRGGLNALMLELAEEKGGVDIHFNKKCVDVDFESGECEFEDVHTGEKILVKSDLIFGSDGAFSAVRAKMQRTDRFNYQQEYLQDGYREILLPAAPDGSHQLDPNALHIWPRGRYMLIALANQDGSFTCTLFMPFEGNPSFESLQTEEQVVSFFKSVFPDFYEMMPDVGNDYFDHPLSSLAIIRCYPWVKGKTALIGDAAHAIVPFYGQGMNSGFEDCTVLAGLMDKYGEDWDRILTEYQELRKPDGDAIAQLAVDNYYVMRDYVADEDFLLRKKIEKKIFENHPDKWMPLYSQVTFSHIRYSDAYRTGQMQDRIMDQVMKDPEIYTKWESDEIEQKILSLLEKQKN